VTDGGLPDPESAYGRRVAERLATEQVIWLSTVAADGTPQPNPVWFVWQAPSTVLIYNRAKAYRLGHIGRRPRVALNFNGNDRGGDIVVLTGDASIALEELPPHEHPDYVAKYRASMIRVSGSTEGFSAAYPVPVRVTIDRVRGL
jgi:PPOX class probable F420-dependent enzyme